MLKRTFGTMSALALVVGASVGLALPSQAAQPVGDPADSRPAATDRIIIGTVPVRSTRAAALTAAVTRTAESAAATLGIDTPAAVVSQVTRNTTVVAVDPNLTQSEYDALLAEIADDPKVAYVEPDIKVYPTAVTLPNDPYLNSPYNQWGFWQGASTGDGGFSSRAPAAWPVSTGSGVVVGVIDTGITAHPDLDANVVAGYDFIGDVDVANDGDGRDSDPSDPGDWITYSESVGYTFYGCRVQSSSWHGTHVAGTIGALTDNATGVAAVAPDVKIQPLRTLGKCGGYTSDIAAAVRWGSGASVSGVPANATPADVLNLSLGGSGSCGPTMQSAIDVAVANGTTVVVAAGNSNTDASNATPASCNNVITVASHTSLGQRSSFSNYGSLVEISGPGSGIWSTLNSGSTVPASPDYASYSGTSMATPHVAGVAALLMAADPSLSPAQVLANLQATAQPFAVGSSCIGLCGAGYVDAQAAVAALNVQPPTALTVNPNYEALDVTWSAPAFGLAPTHYDIGLSDDTGVTWTDDSTPSTSYSYASLDPAKDYLVRVRSATADDSTAWVISTATAPAAPTTPQAVTGLSTFVDDSALQVSWAAPTDTGGRPILEYQVEHSVDDSTWITDDTTATTNTTVANLTNGTPYKVRITPVNAIGAGAATTTDWATPRTPAAPSAPTSFSVTAGNGQLDLSWSAPADDGGRAVTSYTFETSTDDSTWTNYGTYGGTSITISGLVNGTTYSVRVAATNTIGTGPWATGSGTPVAPSVPPPPAPAPAPAPAPPPTPVIEVPGAPVLLSATAANASISASWLASDDTGGEAPSEFTVELDGPAGPVTRTTTNTAIEFTELTNGATYRLRLAAANSAGVGAFGPWSGDLMPIGTPSAPTWVSGESASGSVTLEWTASDDTGGAPVTDYVVRWIDQDEELALTTSNLALMINGLDNGRPYDFQVAAQNLAGVGEWSVPFTLTPRADPVTEPQKVTLKKKKKRIYVRWQAPDVGDAKRYVVAVSINGKSFRATKRTGSLKTRFTISKRTTSIEVQVRAVDPYGMGPWSETVELVLKRKR